ncbi:MAG: AAA family ATPase [Chloroflexi bacterium]|nr:AAA family ATPase [Chloroflexota bacterium]
MNEKLTPELVEGALSTLDYTLVNGRDVIADPGLAQLRRYISVLAIIAAPYAGLGGDQDPLNPLDRAGEWKLLREALLYPRPNATFPPNNRVPLALVRLTPPTSGRLAQALADDSPDAFQVVHLVCHGERDMLYLEDENGHEAYAVAEHVVRLFKPGKVRLVVMDGCFSHRIAQMLLDETSVEAVVGTRRKVTPENAATFAAGLYAGLAVGSSVQEAYRAALGTLETQADRYEILADENAFEVLIPLPPPNLRATRPLVCDGLPRLVDVPQPEGFIGRRELLGMMARDIPTAEQRLYTVTGPAGIGKSWLVAEFVGRFGWRFPGGTLWFPVNAQTTTREIIAEIARLLEQPLYAPLETLLAAMRARPVLVVLDGAEMLAPAEVDALIRFIRSLDPAGESWMILLAGDLPEALRQIEAAQYHELDAFSYKAARTLAMRLAVERKLDVLDVDTIDDFLERALNLPWLIVRGVNVIESDGLAAALKDLSAVKADMPSAYINQRIKQLAVEQEAALRLVVRAQGLPDAFDGTLVAHFGGDRTAQHVTLLIKYGLLEREGELYLIPPPVLAFVRQQFVFKTTEQTDLDQLLINYFTDTWQALGPDDMALTRARRAMLNNTRALVKRQMAAGGVGPAAVADLLAAAAPAFRAAGLAEEFIRYAQAVREKLPEDATYTRLQVALGETQGVLPRRESDTGWTLHVAASQTNLDANVLAEANRAYGRHLARVEQYPEAEQAYNSALRLLRHAGPTADRLLGASILHEWGCLLVVQGQPDEAAQRFQSAVAGYAEVQHVRRSIAVQRDLAATLSGMGELDRAEDLLRRVLATAEHLKLRDECGRLRYRLALLHNIRGLAAHQAGQRDESRQEWSAADLLLLDAVVDLLPFPDTVALARTFHELGRTQARLMRMDDAVSNARRGQLLFDQIDRLDELAEASLTLGQLCMAQGDSVAAQDALHAALNLAVEQGDQERVKQVAGVLVRVHHIRVRHAVYADRSFRRNTLDQASFTRAVLADLGLTEHVNSLDHLMQQVQQRAI